MKHGTMKRMASILLVLVMLMSFIPTAAFATGATDTTAEPTATAEPTQAPEQTEASTSTPTSTPTEAPTETATPTQTPDQTEAPAATAEPTPTPEQTAEPTTTPTSSPEPTAEPTITYTVSITLPVEGVNLADGQDTSLQTVTTVTLEDGKRTLTQAVTAGSAMAEIRLVSSYEDEPFDERYAVAFNERLFKDTGLTASCDENGVITISGTPAADVTVDLESAFADEPTTADASAVYVSSSGDDSTGDGSETSPYATISKAYSNVADGGTIYLLTDVDVSSQIAINIKKTVTITSADVSAIKTIYSKYATNAEGNALIVVSNYAEVIFTNITLDGSGQKYTDGKYYSPCCVYVNSGVATLETGTTIKGFQKDDSEASNGGASVLKATSGGATINIKDGALITGCTLSHGKADDTTSVLSAGSGGKVYMTGGLITGNMLSTTEDGTTAVVNIGMYLNPNFWMTGGMITGNTINLGLAAVYMRGDNSRCDIRFGKTAYVYDNYVNGTNGDQRNVYLKNKTNDKEDSSVYAKLCSALTTGAKLGIYADIISMSTKVAQGDGTYTATAADTTYFVSDKATDAEILYCGGDETTCGLLEHRSGTTHEKAIYLSVSPAVTATKNATDDTITLDIARCTSDATYVVLDKDMKPVTDKTLSGGTYGTNGTFTLTNSENTTTIGMPGLEKDRGPYTVMLVGDGGLTVTDGKANTANLTDIATVNIVNFAGDGVTWSDGTNNFADDEFDIVTVPHNDQTGKATKSYTATPRANYTFAEENAITGKLDDGAETETTASVTATKVQDEEKYNVSVTVPAYGTTSKGTNDYNTVTLKGSTVLSTGVKLLTTTDGTEMTDGKKTYDGTAVAYTDVNLDGVTLSYTWQKKNADGTYTNIEGNTPPSDAGEYNLLVTATSSSDSSKVLSTENLPFIISKRPLTVTATANDKTYDGKMDAELKSAALEGVLGADATAVTLDSSKITVTFADKNAGDSKTVTATAATDALTGDKAGNYVITSATANDAKISPKTITATIKANDKEYDGSASATVSTPTLVSVVENDDVTATASNAVFVGGAGVDNKKTVTADIALSGNDVGNYTLSKTTASDTANITAKELSVTVNADNKQYDGTTDAKATVTLTDTDIIAGETVTLDDSNMKAMFEDADVGSDKNVTVTGLKLSGDSAKNYKLPTSITGTANITQATSGVGTVTLTGWTYGDAANTPTASSTTNPGTATYQYRAKDAADSDPWLDDAPADAGEYTVKATFPANDNYGETTATANFTIAKKTLTATITAKNKEYDGTNAAEVTKVELTGMVNGESVTATASDAHFAGVNARNDQTVTATITLDNSDAAKNYTVASTATTTASITAKTLTVTATAVSKTYDGTTKAEISNVELTGAVGGDTVELNQSSMTAAFENATVGEGKKVTVSGLALDNNDNGNYKLPNTITTTAKITKAEGSGTVTLTGWTYGETAKTPSATSTTNGNTGVTYQYRLKTADESAAWSDTAPTDAGEYTVKATFPANDNYTEATATADFTIAKKALTVNVTAKDKTYDGTQNVELENATLVGVAAADKDNVTLVTDGVSAAFGNKNAGTDKPVTITGEYALTGDAAKNYTVTMPTGLTATITPATLTITGATVTPKTYDGDNDATVTDVTFDGLQNGDTLTPDVDYTVYNAKYDGVNATGDGEATKASFNVVLTNTDAAKNYTLTTTAGSQSATITKASRSDSAVTTEGNRGETNTLSNLSGYVVDGGKVGTITTGGAEIFAETPTYDSTSGTLTYKLESDATENMTATVTLPVTSANYNDYNIVVTVDVTPKETVEIGITEENYVYDGTAHAPTGITVAGNKVLLSALEVTYKSEDGTTYPESTTAPTNAGKYIMTVKVPDSNTKYSGSETLAFEIAKKPLTATISAQDKIYDGTTTATVTPTLTGVVAGDSGKVTASVANPAFEDKNAGENKKVTAAIRLAGEAAGNYTVNAEAAATATISVKEVSITGVTVADSKTYDKTTAATITSTGTIDGKADNDDLRITAGKASYDTANAGTNKTVTFTGFALEGTDAANYKLTGQPASTTASITAKEVTISGVTIDATKVYDGNTTAKITNSGTLTGVEDGDNVTIQTGTATYDDKNAGDNKTVTFSGFELTGTDAANYTLKEQPTATAAAITQREVTISGLTASKTYDGDATADKAEITGTPVVGNKAVESDDVSVNTDNMTGTFNSADADKATTVTITGISLTGTDAGNYKLPETVTCTGTITKADGSGEVTLEGWTYGDTAKTPTVTSTTNGTDNVTYRYKLKGAEDSTYTDTVPTNAGEYTVEATFAATNNYNAVVVTKDFTIAQRPLTMTATAQSKTYDGNATATVDEELKTDGILSGDVVTLDATGVTASFEDKNAGTDKSVTLTGEYKLTGAAASNYTLTQPTGLTANIAKKALTINNLKIAPKTYDGKNTASFDGTPTLDGVVAGETVTLVNGTPTFSSVKVGENIPITFTDFTLGGSDAGNYTVEQPTGITASINAYTAIGNEYTTTTQEWTKDPFVVTAADGWKVSESNTAEGTWSDTLTRSAETGNTNGSLTFYVKNENDGYISEAITKNYKIDKTPPTGEIRIDTNNFWTEFLKTITFGLYYNNQQTVTITAEDTASGVAEKAYLVTSEDLTVAQLADETFTSYANTFGIEPDAELIVYARITDNAGNVTYLRSDGVVLDATAPVINGAENGKTYCAAVTLTITDDYLDTVTVNGVAVTLTTDGKLTLEPEQSVAKTVIATDKAGNSTSITVTVNDGHTWGAWSSNGDNTHTRTCQYDALHTETGTCAGGTATCSAAAVCTTCGGAHGEKDPDNHSNLTHVPYKAATVYSAGNIEYWYCSGCGKYFLDANATNAIAQSYTVIPRLSGGWGVRTGDDSDLALWLTLLLLSGSGSGAALVLGKRKKYGE